MEVSHTKLGAGVVCGVTNRPNYKPSVEVEFPAAGKKRFNSDAFMCGVFERVELVPAVLDRFNEWLSVRRTEQERQTRYRELALRYGIPLEEFPDPALPIAEKLESDAKLS